MSSASRRILIPYFGVVLLLLAELVWWMIFVARQAGLRAEERLKALAPDASSAIIEQIKHEHWQVVRMFVSEGSVFVLLIAAGSLLVWRAMQREMELAKHKTNFLSAVTHELKSPLASIRLCTETMQLRDLPVEKRNHYLKSIHQEVLRFENLVNQVLDTAKVDDGQFSLCPISLNLRDELLDIIQDMQADFEIRGAQLTMDLETIQAFVDANAFNAMLRNLLANALKYGVQAQSRAIELRLTQLKGFAIVTLKDFGVGIMANEQQRIFDKFYRVGDELRRKEQGSGLGLYLVEVVSEGLGKGTTFILRLPLLRA
jgi:signal transduction histidine kinase